MGLPSEARNSPGWIQGASWPSSLRPCSPLLLLALSLWLPATVTLTVSPTPPPGVQGRRDCWQPSAGLRLFQKPSVPTGPQPRMAGAHPAKVGAASPASQSVHSNPGDKLAVPTGWLEETASARGGHTPGYILLSLGHQGAIAGFLAPPWGLGGTEVRLSGLAWVSQLVRATEPDCKPKQSSAPTPMLCGLTHHQGTEAGGGNEAQRRSEVY